jgi:hypothetical protein
MNPFSPGFTGRTRIASSGPAFLAAMNARVQAGLLGGTPHRRSRYQTVLHTQRELAFRAASLATAINVGLNDVVLRAIGEHEIEYWVTYRRWAAYVVGLGAVIGLAIVAALLWWNVAGELLDYGFPAHGITATAPGAALVWGFVAFWTVVWPLLLIVAHKPLARKLVHRIIQEVDKIVMGNG